MNSFQTKCAQKDQLGNLVKVGLLRELYRQHHITQTQFERLMQLQRA
ncbi:MAG: hypothetical protein HDT33_02955 [Clostridiales bacterium]|nr:hypothetical protein [Clostridiales bacterium]